MIDKDQDDTKDEELKKVIGEIDKYNEPCYESAICKHCALEKLGKVNKYVKVSNHKCKLIFINDRSTRYNKKDKINWKCHGDDPNNGRTCSSGMFNFSERYLKMYGTKYEKEHKFMPHGFHRQGY